VKELHRECSFCGESSTRQSQLVAHVRVVTFLQRRPFPRHNRPSHDGELAACEVTLDRGGGLRQLEKQSVQVRRVSVGATGPNHDSSTLDPSRLYCNVECASDWRVNEHDEH
jgi:hypothetical protein